MGILDIFRRKHVETPVKRVDVGALGEVVWSDDDESWVGRHGDVKFYLGFDPSFPVPTQELVAYAESIFASAWLFSTVEREKQRYAEKYPKCASEISTLGIQNLYIFFRKGARHINCQLGYGSPDRFWSLDFQDDKFTGMGFDT